MFLLFPPAGFRGNLSLLEIRLLFSRGPCRFCSRASAPLAHSTSSFSTRRLSGGHWQEAVAIFGLMAQRQCLGCARLWWASLLFFWWGWFVFEKEHQQETRHVFLFFFSPEVPCQKTNFGANWLFSCWCVRTEVFAERHLLLRGDERL